MEFTEVNLVPVFIDIYNRAHDVRMRSGDWVSCENALLALEAARVGIPTEDFTEMYHDWMADHIPF